MNTTEHTSDPTLWRYPSLYSPNRTIHIRNLEQEVARLVFALNESKVALQSSKKSMEENGVGYWECRSIESALGTIAQCVSAHTPTGKEK